METSQQGASVAWKRLRSELLVSRPPWLDLHADDVELPDGTRVEGYLRIDSRPYAMAFATTEDRRVVCVRSYKYGLDAEDLQFPAGYLDGAEGPEACARRELLEETGYEAASWTPLGSYCADGNRGYSWGHFFLARGAVQSRAPNPGDYEHVRVELVPLPRLPEALVGGQMRQLAPIACASLALLRLAAGEGADLS